MVGVAVLVLVLRGDLVIVGVILDVDFIADEFKLDACFDFRVDDVFGDIVCEKFLRGVLKAELPVVLVVVAAIVDDDFIRFANGGDVVDDDDDDEVVEVEAEAEATG